MVEASHIHIVRVAAAQKFEAVSCSESANSSVQNLLKKLNVRKGGAMHPFWQPTSEAAITRRESYYFGAKVFKVLERRKSSLA